MITRRTRQATQSHYEAMGQTRSANRAGHGRNGGHVWGFARNRGEEFDGD